MAIGLMVEARADDRSFQRIAAKAEKQFGDAGRNAGKAFEKGLEAADSRASDRFAKSYDKVADASGRLRVELQKLEDLKQRGAGDAKMIAQSEAVARARRAESRAVNDAANAYKDLSVTSSKLANATSMLGSALSGTRFGALANDVSMLTDRFGAFGLKAGLVTAGIAGIAVGAVAAGKALYDLGSQWDSIADNITMATGKTGAELDSLIDVVGDVGSMTAASLESIGNVVQQLVQQFPNLDTGSESIRIMASNLAFLAENGQNVDIRQLGLAMRVFGVSAESGVKALDDFAGASRKTGVPINDLVSQVRAGAPIFKQFGMDMGAAAAYMGSFESAGIDSASSLQGLRTALAKLTGSGRDAQTVLQETIGEIKRLYDTGNETAARKMAIETFGAKSFAPFLDAIEQGTLDLGKMNEALRQTNIGVQDMQRQVEDGKEGWQKLSNTFKAELKPVADSLFGVINDGLKIMTGRLTEVNGGFKTAADNAEDLRAKLEETVNLMRQFQPDSPLGRMLAPAGAPGAPSTGPTAGAGVGLFGDWRDNGGTFGPGGSGQSRASARTSVPYGQYSLDSLPLGSFPGEQAMGLPGRKIEQHTGPGGYEVDPQKVFDAQTSQLSAQQRLEGARARILELQAKNDRTAQEEQDAKNNLILAERGYLKSQQDLIDAQQGTWKKAEDTTKRFASAMDEFGTQIDKDFGLSKGLPGLAENLIKFLGGLAAAPIMGPLNAMAAAQGGIGKTGSGLLGYLGATGAFGPQFQDFSGVGMPGMMQPGSVSGAPGGASGGTPLVWNQPAPARPWWSPAGSVSSAGQSIANGGRIMVPGSGGGQPYGLPPGTNSGGYGGKGNQFPEWVNQMAQFFGIKPSTYPGHQESNRNEPGYAPNPNHENRGIDWTGPVENLQRFADYLATIPQDLEQVIWQNPYTHAKTGIGGGRINPGYYDDATYAEHGGNDPNNIHVHTRQSEALPIPGMMQPDMVPPGIQSGAPAATGTPPWAPSGTNPGSFYNLPGYPTLNRDTGGPLPPGVSIVQNNTGKPETVVNPQGMAGNQHVSEAFPGPGPGNAGGIGSSAVGPGGPGTSPGQQGPTEIGGSAPDAQNGSSTGAGGGLFGLGVQAAAMAADGFAPGSGAAVQIAGQLMQRGIKFGGQLAGVGVQGLMETFLPTGASQIANDNWLTRIAGGFAGVGAQLPNMAGKGPDGKTPPPSAPNQPMPFPDAPGAKQQAGGAPTINMTLNGVGNVDQTSLNHFTGDISRAVAMPGWAR